MIPNSSRWLLTQSLKSLPTPVSTTLEPTLLFHDFSDTMEETLESRVSGSLVIDKFDFDRLHGSDRQDSLADACAQTAKQTPGLAQGTIVSASPTILQIFVGTEPTKNKSLCMTVPNLSILIEDFK